MPENLQRNTAGWLSLTVASFKGSTHSGALTFLSVFLGVAALALADGAAKHTWNCLNKFPD